jgi:acyl-CoA synthetase (NDP forming)
MRSLAAAKPVIFAGLDDGSAVPVEYLSQLRALNVPYFPSPGRAFRAIARICAMPQPANLDLPARHTVPRLELPAGMIAEYRAKELLKAWNIPFPEGRLATTMDMAVRAATDLGYPIVLKAQSRELPHKSDAGGVMLNIADASALAAGWARLHAALARNRPGLVLDGVLVERMSEKGVELIVGGRNDSDWGAVVLVGFGGVQAEILKDVRLLPPDLSHHEIIEELNLLKSAELLHGFRGSPALDIGGVATLIERIGSLLMAEPRIKEIDLNPVIVYPKGLGVIALDALMVV